MHVSMASSKGVRICNHIHMFLCRSLILKIYPNTGKKSGITAEGEKTNMTKSEGRALLTVETFKTFYFCIESKLKKQEITVNHSPCS